MALLLEAGGFVLLEEGSHVLLEGEGAVEVPAPPEYFDFDVALVREVTCVAPLVRDVNVVATVCVDFAVELER